MGLHPEFIPPSLTVLLSNPIGTAQTMFALSRFHDSLQLLACMSQDGSGQALANPGPPRISDSFLGASHE
jgi:hypothetical protein